MKEKGKIKKVIFEYENEIEYLDEKSDVEGWLKKINDMCLFMANRSFDYKWTQYKWKKIEVIDDTKTLDKNIGIEDHNTNYLF